MDRKTLRAEATLLLASAIWGFAFVAQRVGMESMGPFFFNGLRFGLGALALLPLVFFPKKGAPKAHPPQLNGRPHPRNQNLVSAIALGLLLFGGASLQQIGLVSTTAGKAGFITGLYVLLVPILGLLGKAFPPKRTWIGAGLATLGLYLLSVRKTFTLARGDAFVLAGAFLWAFHVLLVDRISRGPKSQREGPEDNRVLRLAITQFLVCSFLSLLVAWKTESIAWANIQQASIPLLYGSLGSVSIAYTLQLLAQRSVPAAPAAIILSMETVFAATGGWLLLGERMDERSLLGCTLMLVGILFGRLGRPGKV